MTRPPTAAQRRVIDAADPVTGRLRGTESQIAALVTRGLAFRHPRPPHDHFLTPAGHRVRETPDAPSETPGAVPGTPAPPAADAGVFAARVGGEEAAAGGPSRAREVRSAWEGLLELRRMTRPDGAVDRPCGWERTHLVQAAALALEAAGHRPAGADAAAGGYRVRATPQPEAVAVHEPGPEALRACAATLDKAGWQTGEYTEPRTGVRYVLASPRRV
ncbi:MULTISPECIES: hypothetical protein [Streptomyces]|uniref:Uncharacterized protein n=1 Tax=Streptomyces kaempferi TaxID=333725 RepID=A0ABW3XCP6_9ACTN|nr:hypothetical protein [Streptomyces sp. NBC_01455]